MLSFFDKVRCGKNRVSITITIVGEVVIVWNNSSLGEAAGWSKHYKEEDLISREEDIIWRLIFFFGMVDVLEWLIF